MNAQTPTKPEWAQSRREKDNAARVAAGLKPRRRRWPWVVLALAVAGGVVLVGLQRLAPAPEEAAAPVAAETEPVLQLTPAEVATLAPQTLARTVRVTGSLAPQRQTQVSSQISGRVLTVRGRPGDTVREGDVLLELDSESLRIQLDQQASTADATRAQLLLAENQLARTVDLVDRGLTPSSGLDQVRSNVDALRANLEALEGQVASARLALENAAIRATMDGVISERAVQPGQTVQPGASLFTIVDLSTLDLDAAAPIAASLEIAPGQRVEITVEGQPDRVFEGTVERINPVAAAGTRTIPVYIALDNPQGVLRVGMFATGQIAVAERPDAIAVPQAALREDLEGVFLLKREGGRLVRQAVVAGAAWNGGRLVEISEGLAAGDEVVVAPFTQLRPGVAVEMVEG